MRVTKLIAFPSLFWLVARHGLAAPDRFASFGKFWKSELPKPTRGSSVPNKIVDRFTYSLRFQNCVKRSSRLLVEAQELTAQPGYIIYPDKHIFMVIYPCANVQGTALDVFDQFMQFRESRNSCFIDSVLLDLPDLSYAKTKKIDLPLFRGHAPVRVSQQVVLNDQRECGTGNSARGKKARRQVGPSIFGLYDSLNGGLPILVGRLA